MKTLLTIITIILSTTAVATPNHFMCDKGSLLLKYKRLEFSKLNATEYEFTYSKEESCGRGSGCSHLDEKIKTIVTLIESPNKKNVLTTPTYVLDEKIEIDFNTGKCKIKLMNESLKIKAELHYDPSKCSLKISENSKKYTKMIKRILERKGYAFIEDQDAATVNVDIGELQGSGQFLNMNIFTDISIDFGSDGYTEVSSSAEGNQYLGLITIKGMVRKALKRMPKCMNF
jgi:hypothetical protein